jgi:hypothetical protein
MSRRDNGLHATSYTRLLDVESHVADGLLEHLREHDIAAYVAPAAGRRGPYGDTVRPGAPRDSVYVDSAQRGPAQGLVDGYLDAVREELAWAGIVAGYEVGPPGEDRRWPSSEDLDDDRSDDEGAGDEGPPGDDPDRPRSRLLRPGPGPSSFEALREPPAPAEDHFEPPPPPPLPAVDRVDRFAWAAVLGGPLFLMVATVFDADISGWPGFLALCAFVGGFVTLVARMKDRPPADLGGDDGAVV